MAVHGVAFVSERPGPGKFENIEGNAWTDVEGLRQGWGARYVGAGNTDNWFHAAIPSLMMKGHASTKLGDFFVQFQTKGTATVDQVHLWSGATRILAQDGLSYAGDQTHSHLFAPELEFSGPINISVHVRFGTRASEVLFKGAYVRFVTA